MAIAKEYEMENLVGSLLGLKIAIGETNLARLDRKAVEKLPAKVIVGYRHNSVKQVFGVTSFVSIVFRLWCVESPIAERLSSTELGRDFNRGEL